MIKVWMLDNPENVKSIDEDDVNKAIVKYAKFVGCIGTFVALQDKKLYVAKVEYTHVVTDCKLAFEEQILNIPDFITDDEMIAMKLQEVKAYHNIGYIIIDKKAYFDEESCEASVDQIQNWQYCYANTPPVTSFLPINDAGLSASVDRGDYESSILSENIGETDFSWVISKKYYRLYKRNGKSWVCKGLVKREK
jgi:hypothetical protein